MKFNRLAVGLVTASLLSSVAVADSPAVSAVYTGDVFSVLQGGTDRDTVYLGNLDVDLDLRLGSDNGMRAYVYFLGNHGEDPSELVGDAQGLSNIAAPRTLRMYEAWVEDEVLGISLKAGLYDLNSEFDSIEAASLFVHPSFGIGPDFSQAGLNGPSIFPVAGLAVRAHRAFGDNYAQLAVLDGVPGDPDDGRKSNFRISRHEGALIVSEFGRTGDLAEGGAYKLAAGIWHFTSRYEAADGELERGNQGIYLLGERQLIQSGDFELAAFARLGMADSTINSIETYVGGGLVARGFVPGRPQDRMGIAFARAGFSDQWRGITAGEGDELAIEWSYEIPVLDWLTLQPNVQYVSRPSGDRELDDAVMAGLRFTIAYAP